MASEYEICRSLLLKKFKNINNQVTLLIIEAKILTSWSPAGGYTTDIVVCYLNKCNSIKIQVILCDNFSKDTYLTGLRRMSMRDIVVCY